MKLILLRFGSAVELTDTNMSTVTVGGEPHGQATLEVSVEVGAGATPASVASALEDPANVLQDIEAIRPEFRSLPDSQGRWVPGALALDAEGAPVVNNVELHCASVGLEHSATVCPTGGDVDGSICGYSCNERYVTQGTHVCNGNLSSPTAGQFEGGVCVEELIEAPSVSARMTLGNLDGAACAAVVVASEGSLSTGLCGGRAGKLGNKD